jgi:hypothetical protein
LLKFTAHLTKSFSLEVARLFRLEENSYGLDTVARRRMEIRVMLSGVNLVSFFSTRIGQHANGDSLEWNARSSPQLLRSPGMSIAS